MRASRFVYAMDIRCISGILEHHRDWQPKPIMTCLLPVARITQLQCVMSTEDGGRHCTRNVWGSLACSPSHACKRCEEEDGAQGRGALISCARCPIAYHLECMPEAVLASKKKRVWLASSGEQCVAAAQTRLLPHGLLSWSRP